MRKVLRGQRSDIFRTRESSLEPHLPWLEAQWAAGNRNGADLWRRLRASGFVDRCASFLNGRQTEGQITRLKLIKRQMYGRTKLDLLEARFIGAS